MYVRTLVVYVKEVVTMCGRIKALPNVFCLFLGVRNNTNV